MTLLNIACESPAFGVNCSSTCHCFSEGSCNHINGSCISGICAAGWHGENCSQGKDKSSINFIKSAFKKLSNMYNG